MKTLFTMNEHYLVTDSCPDKFSLFVTKKPRSRISKFVGYLAVFAAGLLIGGINYESDEPVDIKPGQVWQVEKKDGSIYWRIVVAKSRKRIEM